MIDTLLTAVSGSGGFSAQEVGTIIGAVIVALLGGGWIGKRAGKAEAQQIGPQPFIVQLREEFATRRELEKLENSMTAHVAEMKSASALTATRMEGLFEQTMQAIKESATSTDKRITNQNDRLNKKVEEVASTAYTARGKIHQKVNDQGERLAKLEERTEIAGAIEKLADSISNPTPKIQPVHSNS